MQQRKLNVIEILYLLSIWLMVIAEILFFSALFVIPFVTT